ncbi:MAG: NAD(P)-binding domain-containing protein, partial [Rhizobiaceae bacterium]|nr:NAD(P)-binding domain-containing protein [Rhizobiaceae bacterium]
MSEKVVLVGAGNMGYAMLAGWIAAGELKPADAIVVEPNPDLRARAAALGAAAFADAGGLSGDAA